MDFPKLEIDLEKELTCSVSTPSSLSTSPSPSPLTTAGPALPPELTHIFDTDLH